MDELSKELHEFLTRLGKHPEQVSNKLQEHTLALFRLLAPADAELLQAHYGLFGTKQLSGDCIATLLQTDVSSVKSIIAQSIRKIAVSPEWQSIKHLTHLKSLKLR